MPREEREAKKKRQRHTTKFWRDWRLLRKVHNQPLNVIRRLAVALQVNADVLIFAADERGPADDLRLQFEAMSKFAPRRRRSSRALLEGMILKHEAKLKLFMQN
jgi:hypothetical protein